VCVQRNECYDDPNCSYDIHQEINENSLDMNTHMTVIFCSIEFHLEYTRMNRIIK